MNNLHFVAFKGLSLYKSVKGTVHLELILKCRDLGMSTKYAEVPEIEARKIVYVA